MSVTGNFFSKLRTLALSLEKETQQLEQVFNQEDNDYETDSPMRVLHDLRSEIKTLKDDLQTTIDKKLAKRQELTEFIKICRVLQQKTASDIQQITDTFQKYGYKPPTTEQHASEITNGSLECEIKDQGSQKPDEEDISSVPILDKPSTSWDLLRPPQLSDFGLSHYQLPSAWDSISDKFYLKEETEKKEVPVFSNHLDIHSNPAKTPKYALKVEDDFHLIENFGISDYTANLNDDYTIALFNKKFTKNGKVHEDAGKEIPKLCQSKDLKNIPTTPAHLSSDLVTVDSPLPPVFFTPGLKVHKKQSGAVFIETEEPVVSDAGIVSENMVKKASISSDLKSVLVTPSHLSLRDHYASVDSPLPPVFCTPGLKVHKKQSNMLLVGTSEDKTPAVTENTTTPPLPTFETNWLKGDVGVKPVDISDPVPRSELSYRSHVADTASLVLTSDKYYENTAKTSSPPKMREFLLGTPPRPELTVSITEDLLKYSMKPSSPPKMSDYDKLLWTPPRPEMTSCITDDISQILSRYCDNNKSSHLALGHKDLSTNSGIGNREYKGKENRH